MILNSNTLILTKFGMRTVQSVKALDIIIDADGNEVEVQSVSDSYDTCVTIEFDNGTIIEVSKDHVFEDLNKTAEELLGMSKVPDMDIVRERSFSEQYIETDPYILGLWYNLGSTDRGRLIIPTVDYNNFAKNITEEPKIFLQNVKTQFTFPTYETLNQAIHFNAMDKEKYIPKKYLFNTLENRKRLFDGMSDSGLLKTDVSFKDDILFLISSLGNIPAFTKTGISIKRAKKMKIKSVSLTEKPVHLKSLDVKSAIITNNLLNI